MVHNYSSYILSEQEKIALSFGLEQHISNRSCKNSIYTEFEQFYQRIFHNIRHLPKDDINRIKTEMRSTCEKYSCINVPYKYSKIVNDLSRNKDIVIMKQDKGRGVVVMNRGKYFDKCLAILNTEKFVQLQKDPTSFLERKVQCTLRKIKHKLPTDVYAKLHPTGSFPEKFYGTAKVHKSAKLAIDNTVEELPLRPIVSNLNTATYQLARYLAKILSPLSRSQYTVESSNKFVNVIKQQVIPSSYKLVSFDVKSLFTNVPLDRTIDIILKRIYDKHEITTNIGRKEMKDLITLCTKNVPFTFNNEIYQQRDGVAMGSPLGPVLAGIIMVELENSIVPKLNSHLQFWKRYVDDALTIVKEGSINHVLQQFNSFHPNIQFTFETESSGRIPFLDILIIKKTSKIKRTVYRKSIDTGIYLNSFSFAPNTWKRGTLKNLVHRAYSICSTEYL